jgi:hypothetical protein
VTACSNRADTDSTLESAVDTAKSVKVHNFRATPKKSFDFNSLGRSSEDTLHLVTCSEFVYFPFGKLTDKSSLKTSLLKGFNISSSKLDTFTNIMLPSDPNDDIRQWSESIDLRLGANKLSLFFDNDPEASMHGYIRGGQINDSNVIFTGDIKVGMRLQDFYKSFFDFFPKELIEKYKVVEFESCVTDVTHIYSFENGRLNSVKFISQ